ncbi:iron complex outermembrane recepter protein [Tistlia consotensis]|uniref:Iron complex outermembrane recepter protein n=1 Tax=Tistlia consotensis USBA 355 TaxID=560819 RepID=A0A1Y6BEH4_9PROT|nr:TonB-dependent copper receptor [Tistlia consotensis]SME97393.1 iron complex outermembrane recepter protein [Tistlia consotensis USBA 355]SNR56729.1 iron complex outermembrane recepter protein [Tistlia consotensis]
MPVETRRPLRGLLLCACAGSALLTAPAALSAAELPRSLPTIEVVDFAPATPATESTDLTETPPARPYSDSGDYLRSLPGVTGGRMGGHGIEPVIRGQSQTQLNVRSDGSYIYGACPNRMDPPSSYGALETFDRVTVVRGYQSVLIGPGGTGGSVILERDAPALSDSRPVTGRFGGGVESNGGIWRGFADVAGGTSQVYARATGAYSDAGDYQDGSGNTVRSSYSDHSAGLTLGWTPGDGRELSLGYENSRTDDALFPGAGMDSPYSDSDTFRLKAKQRFDGEVFRAFSLQGYASLVDHLMDNYSLRTPPANTYRRTPSESDTYGFQARAELAAGEQPFTLALDYRGNQRDATRYAGTTEDNVDSVQSIVWPDVAIHEVGLAAESIFEIATDTRLVLGGRYDQVRVSYGRADERAATSGRSPNDLYRYYYGVQASDHTEHNFGGLARLEWDVAREATVYAGLSRSVRTADATERAVASDMRMMTSDSSWVGNPALAPEKHHQLDTGFDLAGAGWTFGASAYGDYVQDFILRDSARGQDGILVVATDANVYRNVDALLTGFTVKGEWLALSELKLSADGTYTLGQNLATGSALPQIPPFQGTLRAEWMGAEQWSLGAEMRWALTQTRVDLDPTTGTGRDVRETPGYAVFDLFASWSPFQDCDLRLGVTNLFDTTYANHLNRSNLADPAEVQVNEPGRSIFAEARLRF